MDYCVQEVEEGEGSQEETGVDAQVKGARQEPGSAAPLTDLTVEGGRVPVQAEEANRETGAVQECAVRVVHAALGGERGIIKDRFVSRYIVSIL